IAVALGLPTLPDTVLLLANWLQHYYASPIGVVTGLFLPNTAHLKYLNNAASETAKQYHEQDEATTFTDEQRSVLEQINKPDTYVLHGRTGSGKTRVYSELAKRALASNKSALVLCPEIGLTSQLATQFKAIFGNKVVVLHSQLTSKERELAWLRVLTAKDP